LTVPVLKSSHSEYLDMDSHRSLLGNLCSLYLYS
jgi:hypothetical protein